MQGKEETFPIVSEYIQGFLAEFLSDDYPLDILVLETTENIELDEDEDENRKAESMARELLEPAKLTNFGLKLFFEYAKFNLDPSIVKEVLLAICDIHYAKEKELQSEPEAGVQDYDELLAEVRTNNEKAYTENQALAKLKTRVRLQQSEQPDYTESEEQCLICIDNHMTLAEEALLEADFSRKSPTKKVSSIGMPMAA